MSTYFFNGSCEFPDITKKIKEHYQNKNLVWRKIHNIDVHLIQREFFIQFPKLDKLISDLGCTTFMLFRFHPNTCYGWHVDDSVRSCALNMLLEGFSNSHTFVGNRIKNTENADFSDVQEVVYEPDRFVLLDVRNYHTIYNLDNTRYVLSISLPFEIGNYSEIQEYLTKNNF
jgi:hypothetical protein